MKDLDYWKTSELTGLQIKKKCFSKEFLAVMKLTWEPDELSSFDEFPKTTIPYDTLDIAPFSLESRFDDDSVSVALQGIPCTVARGFADVGNFSVIAKELKKQTGTDWKPMQVKRALQQYVRQTLRTQEVAPQIDVK